MHSIFKMTAVAAMVGLATAAQAEINLTAETAAPGSTPGVSVFAFSEVAAKNNVANIQVTPGQTLTNSVKNVTEGKTDVAAAHLFCHSLCHVALAHMASSEKGEELASKLAVLYTPYFSAGSLCL